MYDHVFDRIKQHVCTKLKALAPDLTYHSLGHTLDVLTQCERIAFEEGLTDATTIYLLRVAALYHDTGFLHTYAHHEEESCALFLADAERFGFTEAAKEEVIGLIMATQLPQRPVTLAQKIICDADLDYLGRPDFFEIAEKLRLEFLSYGIISSDEEWEALQLRFLSEHEYFTASSKRLREPVKQKHYSRFLKV